ncbi:MAG TPA: ATP-binding cassette domain-containing protein [Conexibacter sp.]|jgi:ABC-type lipoprotein export system ATPase subunit|nr:ATP-binding cassette domain-containing protein [Conexibacter sp.]
MKPLLRLDSVSKSYMRGPRELRILRDVSLDVHAGEFVGIYGQRGSGKTTLLRVAAGFEAPGSGVVTFDGVDVRGIRRRDLARLHRHDIGWVERAGPQSRELPMRDYVALSLYRAVGPAEAQRRAVAALAKVGAEDAADAHWSSLSDTARMLVAIAHALVREPRLLLVDDPTAGLSIIDRERVVGLLRSAAEDAGLGVLMAVPDMPAMLHAHEVRSLSRGRLLAPADPPPNGGNVVEFPGGERSA